MLIKLINLRVLEKRGYLETNANLREGVNVFCFDGRKPEGQFFTVDSIMQFAPSEQTISHVVAEVQF